MQELFSHYKYRFQLKNPIQLPLPPRLLCRILFNKAPGENRNGLLKHAKGSRDK